MIPKTGKKLNIIDSSTISLIPVMLKLFENLLTRVKPIPDVKK